MTLIYHLTSIENAISIIHDNEIKCRDLLKNPSNSEFGSSDTNVDHTKIYFTSSEEYGSPPKARFVFDSDKINAEEYQPGAESSNWCVSHQLTLNHLRKIIVIYEDETEKIIKLKKICKEKKIKYDKEVIKKEEINLSNFIKR